MSFEIVGQASYAPLNTQIDADRDYRDLAGVMNGLDACGCGGGMPQRIIPPGMQGLEGSGLESLMLLLLGGAAVVGVGGYYAAKKMGVNPWLGLAAVPVAWFGMKAFGDSQKARRDAAYTPPPVYTGPRTPIVQGIVPVSR